MVIVRQEKPEDVAAVRHINEQAFGRAAEADLVGALRAHGKALLSLVAVEGDQVIGHILFSPVTIESDGKIFSALGLAPMAVLPEHQRRGIGSLLVKRGLDECRQVGHECVVVLGHPEYYPRFGFLPASQYGIRSEYDVPDDVFMALELREGALRGRAGVAKYQPEFNEV
jgi:putative acetyltransferase